MLSTTVPTVIAIASSWASLASAQAAVAINPELVGTWSSKSGTVVTGPDFYDPVEEQFKEPRLPGISFSFTADGHYEEAMYIVVSNPTEPRCPTALLQWQHGTYKQYANGSLVLTPIEVDGRQLESDPCNSEKGLYTRYIQQEMYKSYEVLTDLYRKKKRLNLYKHDGSPMNPMYIAYTPPQMLPTQTLNPTSVSDSTGAKATGATEKKIKLKRSLPSNLKRAEEINADRWWWIGMGLTSVGFLGYFCV